MPTRSEREYAAKMMEEMAERFDRLSRSWEGTYRAHSWGVAAVECRERAAELREEGSASDEQRERLQPLMNLSPEPLPDSEFNDEFFLGLSDDDEEPRR